MKSIRRIIEILGNNESQLTPRAVLTGMDFGEFIKARRKELGLTQAELAAISGVGLSFIRNAEHGKPTLQLDLLMRVLNRLDCELVLGPKRGGDHG